MSESGTDLVTETETESGTVSVSGSENGRRSENVSGSENVSASGWQSERRSAGGTRAEGARW